MEMSWAAAFATPATPAQEAPAATTTREVLGGVFEFDVLNRRGMMAIGRGVLSGDTTVTELFVL
jgi:hypothetical protein